MIKSIDVAGGYRYGNNHSGVRFVKTIELESDIENKLIVQLINGESQWTYRSDLRNEEAEPSDVVALKRRTEILKTSLMH